MRLLLPLAVLLAGCSLAGDDDRDDDLREAEARWRSAAPAAYSLTYTVGCFCRFDGEMPYTSDVRGGRIVATVDRTGAAVTDRPVSVDSLFAVVRRARAQPAYELDVAYDARYGYPVRVYVDGHRNIADDETVYTVTAFSAR